MRVGVDLRFTGASHMGTGTYAETATLDLAEALEDGDVTLGFSEADRLDGELADKVMHVRVPSSYGGSNGDLAQRLVWDSAIARADLDVFWAPTGIAPMVKTCPSVITVHDLLFEHEPSCFHEGLLAHLKREIRRSAEQAEAVIAISEFTRKDLISTYGVPADKVHVVHQRLRGIFRKVPKRKAVQKVLKALDVRRPYILTLSNHAPHKNTAFAVEAFARWLEESGDTEHTFVIAGGGPAPQLPVDLAEIAAGFGIGDRVRIAGRVEDAHLPSLYAGASLFLFPSLYEGWGLPPLEALAMGTPVVVSDRGALPEAVGETGTVLPVDDCRRWADEVQRVLNGPPKSKGRSAAAGRPCVTPEVSGEAIREVLVGVISETTSLSPPSVAGQSARQIIVDYRADWRSPSGFGAAARAQAAALERQGILLQRTDVPRDARRVEGMAASAFPAGASADHDASVVIHHLSPDDIEPIDGKHNIGFFVWETDRLPADDSRGAQYNWVRHLCRLDEIWTASTFVREVLVRSGVERPCYVFGHPVDCSFYSPGPRRPPPCGLPDDFDFTWTVFVYVGTSDIRKRVDELLVAYLGAFRRQDRTLLLVKTYDTAIPGTEGGVQRRIEESVGRTGLEATEAPEYRIETGLWPPERVRDLYRSAHAFVTASRGEGFGLCAVEAMACGLPVVASRFSAMEEYVTEDTGYPVPHILESVPDDTIFPWFRSDQRWGVASPPRLAAAMRRVHENRLEARDKGLVAREFVVRTYSPEVLGKAMRERLQEVVSDRGRSRRRPAAGKPA